MPTYGTDDPRSHTQQIKRMLDDAVTQARERIEKTDDPRAEALMETTAEVLQGLITAYDHFEQRSEEAWEKE